MKRLLRFLLYVIILLILIIGTFLIVLTIQDYRPPAEKIIYQSQDQVPVLDTGQTYTVMTWNIGYGGLGKDMDFFYDGGSRVRTDQSTFNQNIEQIMQFLQAARKVDFLFVQELDLIARRSYGVNQFDMMQARLEFAHFAFAKNYDVAFVPIPICNPMGKVLSGLASLSRYKPFESVRYVFPGNYSWPKHLFLLDRCFILNRYQLPDERELVLINTHNSAFDDGNLRKEQLEILVDVMSREFERGNYVVAGGDWNMNPPGFDESLIYTGDATMSIQPALDKQSFPEGWSIVYDTKVPTNRDLSVPYLKGLTPITIIDFFVCSPNIKVMAVQGVNLGFACSDHNPVIIQFTFQ